MRRLSFDETMITTMKAAYLTRRAYIESLIASALLMAGSSAFGGQRKSSKTKCFIQGGYFKTPDDFKGYVVYPSEAWTNRHVFRVELATRNLISIKSQTPAHSVESSPVRPHLAIGVARNSNTASLYDWNLQREVRHLRLVAGYNFYGHCAFSADGKMAYVSAYTFDFAGTKSLTILHVDVESFTVVNQTPNLKIPGHDIARISGTKYAIAGGWENFSEAGSGLTNLLIFDSSTNKFETIESPKIANAADSKVHMTHLLRTSDRRVLAIVSEEQAGEFNQGGIVEFDIVSKAADQIVPHGSPGFSTELLSFVTTSNGNRIWISVPQHNQILVWNRREHRLEKTIEFGSAILNLSFVESENLVVAGARNRLQAFDSETLNVRSEFDFSWPGGDCHHTRLVQI